MPNINQIMDETCDVKKIHKQFSLASVNSPFQHDYTNSYYAVSTTLIDSITSQCRGGKNGLLPVNFARKWRHGLSSAPFLLFALLYFLLFSDVKMEVKEIILNRILSLGIVPHILTYRLIRLIKQIGTCFCSFEKVCYASCCQFVGLPVYEKYNLSNTFFHLLPSFPSSPAHTHSHLGVGLMCKSAYNTYYYEIISYPGM